MAAPHVAGAVALLLEEEDLDPLQVRDRLQNTADQVELAAAPGAGLIEKVIRQGAGMIQIDRAIEAEQRAEPAQISLGDDTSTTTSITVVNDGDEEVEYTIEDVGTLGAGLSTFTPGLFNPGVMVDAPEAVTVSAGGSAEVEVTIDAPGFGLPNHLYGGFITMTPDDEAHAELSIPYGGYDGDYAGEMELLGSYQADGTFEDVEPVLTTVGEHGDVVPVEEGSTLTVRDGELPIVQAFFGHYPERMEVHAVDQRNERRHLVIEDEYLPRSPQPGDFSPFPWDGTVQAGASDSTRALPRGEYVLELRVLRALGDTDNEEHWDTWESPSFELDSRRGGPPSGTPGSGGPGNGGPGNGR